MTDRVSLPAPCLTDAVYVILTSHGVCFQLAYNSRTVVELAWFHPERGDICRQTLLDKIDKKICTLQLLTLDQDVCIRYNLAAGDVNVSWQLFYRPPWWSAWRRWLRVRTVRLLQVDVSVGPWRQPVQLSCCILRRQAIVVIFERQWR